MVVDLIEDAASRKNGATVTADVFYVSASALGSGIDEVAKVDLEQEGPGWYEGSFRPDDPGVYLVRARSGAQLVSAGYVFNPSSEVATGKVDREKLRSLANLSGGTFLESVDEPLDLSGTEVAKYVELWPLILMALLAMFLADLIIRRWETVMGVVEQITLPFPGRKA